MPRVILQRPSPLQMAREAPERTLSKREIGRFMDELTAPLTRSP